MYYLRLQLLRFSRYSQQLGVAPWVFAVVLVILFFVLSDLLFRKTDLAILIYPLIACSFYLQLNESNKLSHFKIIFSKKIYFKLRIIESTLVGAPFFFFLLYRNHLTIAILLLLGGLALNTIDFRVSTFKVIPTPFKKMPFEFPQGFRKYLLIYIASVFLLIKALQVHNFNLGAFSCVCTTFLAMTFYFNPESSYFVWIQARSPKEFIFKKIKESIIGNTILITPHILLLSICFPSKMAYLFAIIPATSLIIASAVTAKYSAFPGHISLPQAILYGLSIWFPPMLIIVIYIFYKKSIQRLQEIIP